MQLTMEQIDFFETFGYLKFPQLLADKIDWIIQEYTLTFPEQNTVAAHDGTKRTVVFPFIDRRLCTLLDDPRIEGIGSSLLGDDFNYMGSDGNYYTGNTKWHRDGAHEKYKHLKIAFYLDKLDGNSGALRVIPGSHRLNDQYTRDLIQNASKSEAVWGIGGNQVPAVVLDVEPGDVLVFNHNLFHSSWNGNNQRRMFTINICQRYEEQDLQLLRDYLSKFTRYWIERAYLDNMMDTASPQRMKHLEQCMANDGHLAAVTAELRKTMAEPARN